MKAFLLLMLGLPLAFAGEPVAIQARLSYEAAFANISTSPSYVLVTIIDGETGQARSVCVNANFLLGAIQREYGLGHDAAASSAAIEIATKSEDHSFRFHRQDALANIPTRYSAAELSAARAFLSPLSTAELKAKFSTLARESRMNTNGYARDAIACVLIERGLSPKMADITGQVYVER